MTALTKAMSLSYVILVELLFTRSPCLPLFFPTSLSAYRLPPSSFLHDPPSNSTHQCPKAPFTKSWVLGGQFCYGVSQIPGDGEKWFCNRCETGVDSAQCMLCPLQDGALKPVRLSSSNKMTPNKFPNKCMTTWCHVSCAWFMPGVNFGDERKMSSVTGVCLCACAQVCL